jgi:hypothetical protein
MQITNETSVAGYLNYMRGAVSNGVGTRNVTTNTNDIQPNYSAELALANEPDNLVDHVILLLAANRIGPSSRTLIRDAVASVPISATTPDASRRNRVNTAIFMTIAAPEYLLQN